jgi:mannosyltransferase
LMVLLIPLHLIWFAVAWPAARRRWRGYAVSLALLTLPYLPLLAWQWPMLRAAERLTGFHYTPLPVILKTTLLNHARGFMPGEPLWIFVPVFFAAALGLLLGWSELPADGEFADTTIPLAPMRRHLLVATWLSVPILAIWVLSLRQPVFTDRYVIWALPAGLLLAALGVQAVRANLARAGAPLAFLLAGAICAAWLAAGWQQATRTIKYDLRGAVRYVAAQRAPNTLLILQIPHLEHAYRYYSSDQGADPFAGSDARLGRWAGGLWTNRPADETALALEVDAQMRALTAGVPDLWLMLSEPDMWDHRRLMATWLEQNGAVVEQAHFHGVQVRHIRLAP